ncbi:YhgN family NAAT transporter [Parendozoicomonas sp. Alg238-R29]|uniref:YhgN family NAAT transporter n=1 Tax=Parendozoicomonas sp. Alg238-R29 TaxID=2993446 RepID=UPI00248EB2C1|nr:YhgN family NAAT transporter [Parendozoicomonas sp. Alg238-R29]
MEIWSAALTLFLIMDPLGNLPVFMSILKSVPEERRSKVLLRELLIALFIMMLFLFAGQAILDVMHLKAEAVSISGGIILFIIAIRMIFPSDNGSHNDTPKQEPFIVPLATPLVAGPSLLASLMLLANRQPDMLADWTIATFGAWLVSSAILMFCKPLYKILGDRGLMAIERLMGMILVMLAVQMLLDGLVQYFQ